MKASTSDGSSSEKATKGKSVPMDFHKSPFSGPQSPPLMCQASPPFAFHKSPFLGPQSPHFKSVTPPSLDDLIKIAPLDEKCADKSEPVSSRPADDDKAEAVPMSPPSASLSARNRSKETSAASPKWDLSPNAASKVSPVKAARDCLFIEDIQLASAETQASEELQQLLCKVNELWKEVRFSGECTEFMTKEENSDLKLTIMVRTSDNLDDGSVGTMALVGFLVYKLHPKKKYLSVRRLAVSPALRRQGRAGQLMNWCVRNPGVNYLALTSTPRALEFYRAFGFRKTECWCTGGTAHPDDEPTGDQVYMEYHPGSKGKKSKGRK